MSRRLVAQVHLAEGADPGVVAKALGAVSGGLVERAHAGAHFDFAVGGGDVTWDLLAATEAGADALCAAAEASGPSGAFEALARREDAFAGACAAIGASVSSVEFGRPLTLDSACASPSLAGVKRTLWLRVDPGTPVDVVARFEAETLRMPAAIPAMRNWHLARIAPPGQGGIASRWTHLWEQEFETVDGLHIDYMSSPIHWGLVDRWFDVEMPDRIVDPWLAHLACPATESVLGWEPADPAA